MDTLLSVLLSLHAITVGGHYTSAQIDNYAAIYASQITLVETTPGSLFPILAEYEPQAIVIWDNVGG